jgi:hypothetical protein
MKYSCSIQILEKIGEEGTFGKLSWNYVTIKYIPAVVGASSGNYFSKRLGGLPVSVFRELQSLKCLSGSKGIIR